MEPIPRSNARDNEAATLTGINFTASEHVMADLIQPMMTKPAYERRTRNSFRTTLSSYTTDRFAGEAPDMARASMQAEALSQFTDSGDRIQLNGADIDVMGYPNPADPAHPTYTGVRVNFFPVEPEGRKLREMLWPVDSNVRRMPYERQEKLFYKMGAVSLFLSVNELIVKPNDRFPHEVRRSMAAMNTKLDNPDLSQKYFLFKSPIFATAIHRAMPQPDGTDTNKAG